MIKNWIRSNQVGVYVFLGVLLVVLARWQWVAFGKSTPLKAADEIGAVGYFWGAHETQPRKHASLFWSAFRNGH